MWSAKEGGGNLGVVDVQSASSRDRLFTSGRCRDFHPEGTTAFKWELHCSHSGNESDVTTNTPGAGFSPKIFLPWLRTLGRRPGKPKPLPAPVPNERPNRRRVSRALVPGCVKQGLLHSRIVLESCLALPRPPLASPPYRFLATSGSCERPAGQERKSTPIYFLIHRTRRCKSTHFDDGVLW
jgi:hypothetical protein